MARKRLATTKQTHRLTNNTTVNIPDCTAVEPVRDSCCLPALPLRSNPRNKPRNYVGRDSHSRTWSELDSRIALFAPNEYTP